VAETNDLVLKYCHPVCIEIEVIARNLIQKANRVRDANLSVAAMDLKFTEEADEGESDGEIMQI